LVEDLNYAVNSYVFIKKSTSYYWILELGGHEGLDTGSAPLRNYFTSSVLEQTLSETFDTKMI
jgi:hypothetical protein